MKYFEVEPFNIFQAKFAHPEHNSPCMKQTEIRQFIFTKPHNSFFKDRMRKP